VEMRIAPQLASDFASKYFRELRDAPSYVTAINMGNTDVTIDLSVFPNLGDNMMVEVTGATSKHEMG
jgi:hypothetical protein